MKFLYLSTKDILDAHHLICQGELSSVQEKDYLGGNAEPLVDGNACESLSHESSILNAKNEIRNTHINIGTGIEISIRELVEMIKGIIGFQGELKDGVVKMYEWLLNDE